MKYDAVLFDLDGTVLDTVEDIADSLNRALENHGFARISTAQAESFLGNGTRRLVELALPESCPESVKEDVIEEYRGLYDRFCHEKTRPYRGMVELIKALKAAGVKTAIVSNKPDSMVQTLATVYYPGVPDVVLGEREGLARKPAPDMVQFALKAIGAEAGRSIYVGDTEVDILTARNAGLGCISVPWGFRSREQLEKAGADPIADTVEELARYLGL
ncbi:MAG: HAD family hydrolase [Clostridiales bacterium]|nr:HAD family hydrolase [Clostridiales bacterium]